MKTGETFPNLTFLKPDGTAVALSELLVADRTLILMMRHLA